MTETKAFDPGRHLSLINGNEYLEVKWRLVWFRSEHPDGSIETEMVHYANNEVVFKATVKTGPKVVTNPDTGEITTVFPGIATGWGSEDAQSFGDYIEKAETKAIGRALAALGFGTQFTQDFDYGASHGRVVDAPVDINRRRENQVPANFSGTPQRGAGGLAATDKQLSLIQSLSRDIKIDARSLNEIAQERTGRTMDQLSRQDASSIIDYLKERQQAKANAIAQGH